MKEIIKYIILFSVFSCLIELFVNEFDFNDTFNDVSLLLSFDKDRTKGFTIHYTSLNLIAIAVYAFIALLSLNIFGSGLGDEGVGTLRRVASSLLVFTLIAPLYNMILIHAAVFGAIISYILHILFFVTSFSSLEE